MDISLLRPGCKVFVDYGSHAYNILVKYVERSIVCGDWRVINTGELFKDHTCEIRHFKDDEFKLVSSPGDSLKTLADYF